MAVFIFLTVLLLPIITVLVVIGYRIKTRDRNNPHVQKETTT